MLNDACACGSGRVG